MFVGIQFGILLHKCVQSVHTFTVTIAIVIENGSIKSKEWNMCNCLMANQNKQKSNYWSIDIFVLIFLPLHCSPTFSVVREDINKWIESNSFQCSCNEGTVKNPLPWIEHGISPKRHWHCWLINVRKYYWFIPITTYRKHLTVSSRCNNLHIRPLKCKVSNEPRWKEKTCR